MAITLLTDVSHYQGVIDWAAVARTAYRAGVARMTIGRTTLDDQGRRNLRGMLDHMPVAGAYGVVGYTEPVEDGADLLVSEIRVAGGDPAGVLVMLDAEDFGPPDFRHPTIGQVDRFAQRLHTLIGRWPIAYVPSWWLGKYGYTVAGRALSNCPWAPSHYLAPSWTEAKLQANKPADLHGFKTLAWLQYTDAASISGIAGGVDANCFYGTVDQLRAQLLGQPQEDLTMADAQDILNALGALTGRLDRAVLFLGGVNNTIYSNSPDSPRPLPDMAKAATLKDIQQLDASAVAALVAGQLEVTGISTGAGGVVTVTFGPAA